MDTVRIDRWLTAVRLYKQRTVAADACGGGKIRLNGRAVKPSTPVKVGDTIEARINSRLRVVEVTRVIEKRVGAPIAAQCYIDRSPEPDPQELEDRRARQAEREAGAGRPTKRDRRQMDRMRGGRGKGGGR